MYVSKYRKELDLMHFPGRIPFVQHLWRCLKQYCILERDIERDILDREWEVIEEDTWGHYDDIKKEWIKL